MKPSSGRHVGREKFPIVYVNSFGRHRCGAVIHYGSCGHHIHHEKVGLADGRPCLPDKALPAISDKRGSAGTAPLSPWDRKSPCFGEAKKVQAKGAGICGSQAPSKGKRSESRKVRKTKKNGTLSSPYKDWSSKRVAVSSADCSNQKPRGGCGDTRGDVFEFPASLENVIKQQNKKSAVWLGVYKVISKMVEENGNFRNRLMSCSQHSSQGTDANQNVQNGTPPIDTDEAIFGWV